MTIVVSLAMAACNSVIAQSIETLTGQPKVANPQIKIGGSAEAIAVNQETNKVYAYNPLNGTVSIIDSNFGSTVKNIRVGKPMVTPIEDNPIVIDYSLNKIYVANAGSNTVLVIDGGNDTIIAQIKVGERPFSIAIGGPNRLYVVNENNTVSVINSSSYKRVHNIVVNGPLCIKHLRHTGMFYVGNESVRNNDYGTVSIIDPSNNDTIIKRINVGKSPCPILEGLVSTGIGTLKKVYVANTDSNTVSVINAITNTNTGKDIPVGKQPVSMTFAVNGKLYVANKGSNSISVINPRDDTTRQNITLGFSPDKIASDYIAHKVYVPNPNSNTVSVIDGSNRTSVPDRKDPHDILVGNGPDPVSFNPITHMIYVGNLGSTISVIKGFTSNVAAGVRFNIHPGDSGTMWCGGKEYPIGTYMYVDNGTSCTGQGKNNFGFDGWVQNTGRNSTLPVVVPSGNLVVDRYGNFTANFKPLPPPIPPEYTFLIISVIISSLVGWSIPTIVGWIKERNQRRHLKECIRDIGKLGKKGIEEKAIKYYVDGKIDGDHHKLLKDKIAEYYGDQEN